MHDGISSSSMQISGAWYFYSRSYSWASLCSKFGSRDGLVRLPIDLPRFSLIPTLIKIKSTNAQTGNRVPVFLIMIISHEGGVTSEPSDHRDHYCIASWKCQRALKILKMKYVTVNSGLPERQPKNQSKSIKKLYVENVVFLSCRCRLMHFLLSPMSHLMPSLSENQPCESTSLERAFPQSESS